MPEFVEWRHYFESHLGGYPVVFKMILDEPHSEREYTVPELQPEWFDPTYQLPGNNWTGQ